MTGDTGADDLPPGEMRSGGPHAASLGRDAARVGAELVRMDGGTDPFAAMVRATRMPMIVTDPRQPDNPTIFVNDAFCRLSGYRREEIIGRNCRFLQGPDSDPADVARIRVAIEAREPYEGEVRNHRKDGTTFWNRLLVAPVRDSHGEVAYFFASQVDVTLEREHLLNLESVNAALLAEATDRRRELEASQARLQGLNETLEARVAERTAELRRALDALRAEAAERERAEAALRQAQKMEAVGQLTGGIAHDLNNMLQGVSGALDFMRRRIEAGRLQDVARYLDPAQASVARAAALTHRLLSFARRQALVPRRIVLDEVIGSMGALIGQSLGPAIALDLRLTDGVWAVRCDANGLENVLLNLAINARDAMPGGGRLTIATTHEILDMNGAMAWDGVGPGDYVRLTVTDTGTGMAPDVLIHAFEPFYTTKPAGQGTGLGLSQVWGFVRQSGGGAWIESEAGRGTSVHLLLPRDEGEAEEDAPAVARTMDGEALNASVLLVEDEEAVRALAAEALRELGCRVTEAADGAAGLAALRQRQRVDLLIADVGLPGGLNGRQLADAARELRPGLPVLLITGYAGDAIGGDGLPVGIGVLGKPFDLDALAHRVRKALDT